MPHSPPGCFGHHELHLLWGGKPSPLCRAWQGMASRTTPRRGETPSSGLSTSYCLSSPVAREAGGGPAGRIVAPQPTGKTHQGAVGLLAWLLFCFSPIYTMVEALWDVNRTDGHGLGRASPRPQDRIHWRFVQALALNCHMGVKTASTAD